MARSRMIQRDTYISGTSANNIEIELLENSALVVSVFDAATGELLATAPMSREEIRLMREGNRWELVDTFVA